jgi:flagellin-like hook-associated protein FlgL
MEPMSTSLATRGILVSVADGSHSPNQGVKQPKDSNLGPRIASRVPSRQTAQAVQLCALAVARKHVMEQRRLNSGISVATQASALTAQGQVDSYLDNLDSVSGIIGSALSRFAVAARLVASTADVTKAAEGRIMDADVAADSANLTRNNILQQAASAVLAQANQQPALALKLLGK